MDIETQFPVLRRELRLALQRSGFWRASLQWMALGMLGTGIFLLMFRIGVFQPWFYLPQLIISLTPGVVALMPVGFVRDREAGQQSLLGLTGLGPLRVFLESACGSLWAAAQIGLYALPAMLVGATFHQVPFHRAFLAALLPGFLVILLASVRILSVAARRTLTGAALLYFGILAGLVAPLFIYFLAGTYLPEAVRGLLRILWGADNWGHLNDIFRPRAPLAAFVSCLVRIGLLNALLLAVAAMFYCRDWRRTESNDSRRQGWSRSLPFLLGSGRRRPVEGNPYLARYPAPGGWRRIRWVLAGLTLGVGVAGAATWSWMALPVALTLWCSVVDLAAHLVVSGAVAQDRRDGAFELLFTTALMPREVLDAANQVGRGMVRDGFLPGLVLLLLFVLLALRMAGSEPWSNPTGAMTHLSVWALPVAYFAALHHLPFRLPASQSANTGEPFHAFSMPLTAFLVPLIAGLVAFLLSIGSPEVRFGVAVIALLVLVVMLIARESFASDKPLSDEELRTVAAAPLPTLEVIPKDGRTTSPWIPEGFQR